MVKIAGSKKLKRQMAPLFWGITRKDKRFVVTVKPGSHGRSISIPSSVFLRDTLKIVKTLREAKSVIYDGKVLVDGIKRKSLHHGIGLMDVVELDGVNEIYSLVPKAHTLLAQYYGSGRQTATAFGPSNIRQADMNSRRSISRC